MLLGVFYEEKRIQRTVHSRACSLLPSLVVLTGLPVPFFFHSVCAEEFAFKAKAMLVQFFSLFFPLVWIRMSHLVHCYRRQLHQSPPCNLIKYCFKIFFFFFLVAVACWTDKAFILKKKYPVSSLKLFRNHLSAESCFEGICCDCAWRGLPARLDSASRHVGSKKASLRLFSELCHFFVLHLCTTFFLS